MIKRLIRVLMIAIAMLPAKGAFTQPDLKGYHIQHYTDEEGLPQNSVHNMLFDDNGYLWLATQIGLSRFDGNTCKVYDRSNQPGLTSDRVLYLGKGEGGSIYFQTQDNHLFLLRSGEDTLTPLFSKPVPERTRLLNDRNETFDCKGLLTAGNDREQQDKAAAIFQALYSHAGNFFPIDATHAYLDYKDSLYYFDNRALTKISPVTDRSLNFLVAGHQLYTIRQGKILSVFVNGTATVEKQSFGGDLGKDLDAPELSGAVFRLYPGKTPHALLGTKLYRITPNAAGRLQGNFLLDLGFTSHISSIAYHPGLDLLVVSTETDGFWLIRKDKFQGRSFPEPLQHLLSGYLFGPLVLDKDHNIVTSRFLFNERGDFTMLHDDFPSDPHCLYIDHKNHVWSAAYSQARELGADRRTVKAYPALDARVMDFREDPEEHLYCLTETGLWRLQNDSFKLVPGESRAPSTGSNECFAFTEPGKCWIGSTGGLFEVTVTNGRTRKIPELGDAHVRCIYRCKDHSVLVGTYGQGYFYFRKGHFYKMPLDKNNFLVTAHCFLEDPHGALWISSNKGLFEVMKKDLDEWCDSAGGKWIYYYYYGRQDGLKTNEFNGGFNPSGQITDDGFISLLSMKGMVCFQVDSIKPDLPSGHIEISDIRIDGKIHAGKDSLVLDPDYNSLALEVSSPFLGNRNNLYLQFCLDGKEETWKEVAANGKIILNTLQPGNHTLQIRKFNGFGIDNFTYRELKIRVIPRYYQASWFRILAIALALLLLVLFIQLRLNLVEKKKEVRIKGEKLKGTVSTLEETVEKLKESQKALLQTSRMREKLISLIIHDLRSPIRFLTLLANDLHDHLASFSETEKRERTYWIKKGTNDIYNFSEDFLLWITSQKDNFNIVKRTFFIKPLLQEIHDFYKEQVQLKGNTILYEAADELTIYSDPHILITIIRNLVDNANKYTEGGKIMISAREEAPGIVIRISDTGKGMTREQVDMFLKNDGLENVKSGSQLGHKFVLDLTMRIQGAIAIETSEGQGTTVTISFSGDPR